MSAEKWEGGVELTFFVTRREIKRMRRAPPRPSVGVGWGHATNGEGIWERTAMAAACQVRVQWTASM